MPLYVDPDKAPDFVRVYPSWNGNWDSDDPISMEMKPLGYGSNIAYAERLTGTGGGFRNSRRQRTERYLTVMRAKLKDVVREGSIQGVYDIRTREPITDVDRFLSIPVLPMALLNELEDMADDVSTLQAMSEDAWQEYRKERVAAAKDAGTKEPEIERELERERLAEDESGN